MKRTLTIPASWKAFHHPALPETQPRPRLVRSAFPTVQVPEDIIAFADSLGFRPDSVQTRFLRESRRRLILCCARQWGKSTVVALKALHRLLRHPGQKMLIVSRTHEQALRLLLRVRAFCLEASIPCRINRLGGFALVFGNGSRIFAMPNNPDGQRSFDSINVLIVEEAALVPDYTYHAMLPTLGLTGGEIWLLSTPRGRQGFFYRAWSGLEGPFVRFHVPAAKCPRISASFLESMRTIMPDCLFRREYLAEFVESGAGLLSGRTLTAVVEAPPLPGPAALAGPQPVFAGLDVGQRRDHTALAVLRRVAVPGKRKTTEALELTHLLRFPLHESYTALASGVTRALESLREPARIPLAIDASSVGEHLCQLVTDSAFHIARAWPVVITSGRRASVGRYGHNLPRRQLVARLAAKLEAGELFFSPSLPASTRAALQAELRALRADCSSAGPHDDLAMALALALWLATQ